MTPVRSEHSRRARIGAVLAAAGVAVFGSLLSGHSAAAVTGDSIEVSPDGVNYGRTYPGSLFGELSLVPGSTETATLWVRNPTASRAWLRVTLESVVTTGPEFENALALQLTTPQGALTTPLALSASCAVLAGAVPMEPGESVPLNVAISLGTLDGLGGQGGRAQFTVGLTLSEVPYLAANCTIPAINVPGTSGVSEGGPRTGAAAGPTTTDPLAGGAGRGVDRSIRGVPTDFNTLALDLVTKILFIGSALGIGAAWFMSVSARRGRAPRAAVAATSQKSAAGGTP